MMHDDVRHTRKKPPSAGVSKGHSYRGMLRTVVSFDRDTHETIRKRAVAQDTSFGEQVRQLVEWGLMSEEDAHG